MGGNKGGGCGAGDVAGVPLGDGLSDQVRDDRLEGGKEDGSELKVPVGEPSGVKTAGPSVFALVLWVNRPCLFRNLRVERWAICAAW